MSLDLSPARLAAANICPETGLATDYLNHFNEVAMLVDMLADMPEMADEIADWRPRSYPDHFHATGFRDKELAIAAFESADPAVLARFAAACRKTDAAIADVQARLAAGVDPAIFASAAAADLYDRIAAAGAVILGHAAVPQPDEQAAVDALFS
jgi:hypothetical protein